MSSSVPHRTMLPHCLHGTPAVQRHQASARGGLASIGTLVRRSCGCMHVTRWGTDFLAERYLCIERPWFRTGLRLIHPRKRPAAASQYSMAFITRA